LAEFFAFLISHLSAFIYHPFRIVPIKINFDGNRKKQVLNFPKLVTDARKYDFYFPKDASIAAALVLINQKLVLFAAAFVLVK
jgi:hypothetical protein